MKSKILVGIIFIAFTQLPMSCGRTGFGGIGEYEIEGIDVSAGQISKEDYGLHEYDFTSPDTLVDSLLGIAIMGKQKFAEEPPKPRLQNPFVTVAMADPPPPRPADGMDIALISIYADESVFADGKEFKAGKTLSNLFSVRAYGGIISTLPKYIESSNSWTEDYDATITLQFTGSLDKPLAQPLTIKVTLENESEFEDTTRKIVIKP